MIKKWRESYFYKILPLRRAIILVVILLGIAFIAARFSEIEAVTDSVRRGDWRFLLLAVAIQAVWLVTTGLVYRSLYAGLCMEEHSWRLVLLSAGSFFSNIVAPSGVGMSGMAVFISDGHRRELPRGKITIAGVLFTLIEYVSFLMILGFGLAVLIRRNNLNIAELVAAAILLVYAVVLFILFVLAMRSETALANALVWLTRKINRISKVFIHREYLSEQNARSFAHEAVEGLHELRSQKGYVVLSVGLSFFSKVLLILVLLCLFYAFSVPFSPGTIIASFSLSYLFTLVSPTPAGLGVVEGAMPVVLISLGVPIGAAATITLVYRGITFWLPFLFGMAAIRLLAKP